MPYKYYEKIREMREDRKLSQQDIADLLHIGQRTYSDYETGKTRIPVESVIALAKFYDVDLNYLTGISQEKNPFPEK
ncbi:helix-turn-helix domain-containing protein [Neglectibacter caecimuris]|uniref:helix-turn-helix domain-containing protein n=1 Tax=Neglectibacter caecimuris TaxID=3093658 RepID=UPI002AC91CE9|nr:helix-turn-helix transcriptional regulator [Neglectibacter sp. M00184]